MKTFGETLRELRTAQDLGLRETAMKAGISPAYLSRIERSKEKPPRAEVIKELARLLAADPDVLFRLSSSTDPDLMDYVTERPGLLRLLRFLEEEAFTEKEAERLLKFAAEMRGVRTANHEDEPEIILRSKNDVVGKQ